MAGRMIAAIRKFVRDIFLRLFQSFMGCASARRVLILVLSRKTAELVDTSRWSGYVGSPGPMRPDVATLGNRGRRDPLPPRDQACCPAGAPGESRGSVSRRSLRRR